MRTRRRDIKSAIPQVPGTRREEILVEGQYDVGLSEVVVVVHILAEGQVRSLQRGIAMNWLVRVPFCLRKFLRKLLTGLRERGRGNRFAQDADSVASF